MDKKQWTESEINELTLEEFYDIELTAENQKLVDEKFKDEDNVTDEEYIEFYRSILKKQLLGDGNKRKLYLDYEKEFVSPQGIISATRGEFGEYVCPMLAEELDDERMQSIVNDTESDMTSTFEETDIALLREYRSNHTREFTTAEINKAERMSSREFEFFESNARKAGMRYVEDLTEEEYAELQREIEEQTKKN